MRKLLSLEKSIKIFVSTGIALALYVGGTEISEARYLNYGSPNSTIAVDYSLNTTWTTAVNSGRSAWNNSTAPVKVNKSSSSNNKLYAANYSDSWYGVFTPQTVSGSRLTKFQIRLNARTINRDSTNFQHFVQSTSAHEFGHAFWLADNPNTNSVSLMKHNRSRQSIRLPQGYDICLLQYRSADLCNRKMQSPALILIRA
ncbi:hypothetical protein MM326_18775 [Alkalihalobacillus sp. LMS6]|uniref:hypothetical protein n=1 Tax=Alkalihalobacillus sp. LMS6 TaxID=2924034 RepID=UPI0020D0C17C|nr:hypothetical protein [Alkalihalobacillus sp. LMS6]UTR06097.1 hypothetical protein MM326_18775 [Alkalihalobacillus sp. LMS6]